MKGTGQQSSQMAALCDTSSCISHMGRFLQPAQIYASDVQTEVLECS